MSDIYQYKQPQNAAEAEKETEMMCQMLDLDYSEFKQRLANIEFSRIPI